MKYTKLRKHVCEANLAIVQHGLVTLTWGNVSAVDRKRGVMAIKPSGVPYAELTPAAIVICDLDTGNVQQGSFSPSSDTPTHLHLYRAFPDIGAIVHTHSPSATAWAQLARPLPCYGTTHADHFNGAIPVARPLRADEIEGTYEHAAGVSIVDTFQAEGLNPLDMPAAFLPGHAPFVWGTTLRAAIDNAVALEEVARMALLMGAHRDPAPAPLDPRIVAKHFNRKHGAQAYYGQPATERKESSPHE